MNKLIQSAAGGKRGDRGVSLAEMLISLFLLTATLLMVVHYIGVSFTTTKANKEKDFATQKAIQIVNELRAYVQGGGETHADMLDNYDDGIVSLPVLTTQKGVTEPADPLSENQLNPDGNWNYLRRVNVYPVPNENSRDVRMVHVKIFKTENGLEHKTLADITTIIRTVGDFFPPSQVYDIYCIAVENVPGWWVHMSTIRPLVENSINDLQSRNPGLEFRVHWITRHGYGRDPLYTPFLNLVDGPNVAVDWVYHYPGLVRTSDNFLYYDPEKIGARLNVDGAIQNAASYALADEYNHCVRYPRELEMRAARAAEDTEPSLRQLLEELNSNPENFNNAIILNLHGELLPTPPIRNFSDAAKDPETDGTSADPFYGPGNRQGVRVVVHPENLEYENTDDVTLRVYAYLSKAYTDTTPSYGSYAGADNRRLMQDAIVIRIPGVVLNDTQHSTNGDGSADFDIRPIYGGVLEDNPGLDASLNGAGYVADDFNYRMIDVGAAVAGGTSFDLNREWRTSVMGEVMYSGPYTCYEVELIPDDAGTPEDETASVISLYYTPLECPEAPNGSGMDRIEDWLYGQEYIPCPTRTGVFSDYDLCDTSNYAKNTARWIITLKEHVLPDNDMLTIQTRITDLDVDVTDLGLLDAAGLPVNLTGTVNNHPYNLSETYTWIGINAPVTERCQILGDPRHCPYADVKLDHRYNWFYRDDGAWTSTGSFSGDYAGFNRCRMGWSGNRVEFDWPRQANLLRSGILNTGAMFTTMNGFSFYYVGLGHEVGADSSNGFGSGIPVNGKPYDGSSGSIYMKGIIGSTRGVQELANSGNNKWFLIPWLGELFPDAEFLSGSTYQTNGNLSANTFRNITWRSMAHTDLDFTNSYNRLRRTSESGCATFFNATGSGNGPFSHYFADGQASYVTEDGEEMGKVFNFPMPDALTASRPFHLDYGSRYPNEWNYSEYSTVRNNTEILKKFYTNSSSRTGNGLVALQSADNPDMNLTDDDYGFFVMSGLDRGVNSGEAFLGRLAVLALINGVMNAGVPGTDGRIHQLPRLEITSPSEVDSLQDPTSIPIAWETEWRRWDDEKYLSSYPDGFSESDTLVYAVKYSIDSGATWRYMQDNSSCRTGVPPESGYECSSEDHYNWNVSNESTFPEGSYIIRTEVYREDKPLHYSYHQRRIFIQR